MNKFKKVSIVIPVYNEKNTISEVINRGLNSDTQGLEKEIIIVDDFSTDGTQNILKELKIKNENLKIIFHKENQGKGAALKSAFSKLTGDIIIIQDADLEYNPQEYPNLLKPILDGNADVVYGSRFLGGPHRVIYFHHYLANKFLTFLSNIFTNLNLTDMETCYKIFTKEVLQKINITSNRFGFEPEFTAKIAKIKAIVYETPISYYGRTYEQGKKINWKDGISAIWWIIKYNLFE